MNIPSLCRDVRAVACEATTSAVVRGERLAHSPSAGGSAKGTPFIMSFIIATILRMSVA